jgi:predicted Zn-ribbon and HTH transcriptional regulator
MKYHCKGNYTMAKTNAKINTTAEKVLEVLKKSNKAMTWAEICEAAGITAKSTGAITRLMASEKNPEGVIEHGEEVEVEVIVKKKAKTYKLVGTTTTTSTAE